jgi:hypothetical protein
MKEEEEDEVGGGSFDTVLGLFWHCTRSLLTLY